jgi:four helix bundle protein
MGTVEEEADESIYWLELLVESGNVSPNEVQPLMKEANELLSIVVSSINTARRNKS